MVEVAPSAVEVAVVGSAVPAAANSLVRGDFQVSCTLETAVSISIFSMVSLSSSWIRQSWLWSSAPNTVCSADLTFSLAHTSVAKTAAICARFLRLKRSGCLCLQIFVFTARGRLTN